MNNISQTIIPKFRTIRDSRSTVNELKLNNLLFALSANTTGRIELRTIVRLQGLLWFSQFNTNQIVNLWQSNY